MIEECRLVEPFSCNDSDSACDVAKKLQEFGQRHIYVIDSNKKPVGIISVADIMNNVVCEGKESTKVSAADIMNKDIHPFDDNDKVKAAYKVMTEKNIVSVPVTEDGKFIGILTLKEAIKHLTNPEKL